MDTKPIPNIKPESDEDAVISVKLAPQDGSVGQQTVYLLLEILD